MISKIMQKMIISSNGSMRDINHFLKVWAYAKNIGEAEHLDEKTKFILEIAAIVHDIACPSLRARYGCCDGKLQEKEGPELAENFLKEFKLSEEYVDRVTYLVGHHHSTENVDGLDYRILLEADYLVNADESKYSRENIENTYNTVFRTETGRKLLSSMYF